eukprot:CAMPEP_0181191278 /NCGR_PEP_ID=MMETSP1096-20121128/12651_1 /TAXON_ID=156174 ORGANISM="Chrysochromulina ericina, Strain CCMP281" /NCGR_SAMPLE_ID=MMETSP1096 /ASSEMBLY_ACC=CAM_ASM_000453 /LENGTH=37 /DNA_ID= /DNA_START= /DNA_END= /DNA_ORIENTATION=
MRPVTVADLTWEARFVRLASGLSTSLSSESEIAPELS